MSSRVNLFVYGTLMDSSFVHQLTGKSFRQCPACLQGFKKITSDLGYPYVIPDKRSRVEGFVIRAVDELSLKKLDHYEREGRLYYRRKVAAVCDREKIPCEVYVGNQEILSRVTSGTLGSKRRRESPIEPF